MQLSLLQKNRIDDKARSGMSTSTRVTRMKLLTWQKLRCTSPLMKSLNSPLNSTPVGPPPTTTMCESRCFSSAGVPECKLSHPPCHLMSAAKQNLSTRLEMLKTKMWQFRNHGYHADRSTTIQRQYSLFFKHRTLKKRDCMPYREFRKAWDWEATWCECP